MKRFTASGMIRISLWLGAFILTMAMISPAAPAGAALTIRESSFRLDDQEAPSFIVENPFFSATVVPDMGGRILEWRDKASGRDMVYAPGYGGLLDDHDSNYLRPYAPKWLKKGADQAVIEMSMIRDEVTFVKKLTFFAERPVIQVDYHVENRGQDPQRLLFRNVVRPGGSEFSGQELYCYSLQSGLKHVKGMPRVDDIADPWCALVHQGARTVVSNYFEGDILARLYTWQGGKVAPTYEFMFPQLQAGKALDARYYWQLSHGLTAVDYAHRNFVAQLEGKLAGTELKMDLSLVSIWEAMPDLKVSGRILNPARKTIASLPERALPATLPDRVQQLSLLAAIPAGSDYVIAELALRSKAMPTPVVVEKAFSVKGEDKLPTDYQRPVRWLGGPVKQAALPGWSKEVKYVIQPQAADRRRGYMLFEETGEERGRHTQRVTLHVGQDQAESFPLHFHAITCGGKVDISLSAPSGLSLESFVPEEVPQVNWGKTVYGLKLNPGQSFAVKPGDDRTLYFRLNVGRPAPGRQKAVIEFKPEGMAPTRIEVEAVVYPVRMPRHPYMVFDLNNAINYQLSRKEGKNYIWDDARARNYLDDMQSHGVHGQTLNGTNAPNTYTAYGMVRDRSTGLPLPEAVKKDPKRFQSLEKPALDFSAWDWMMDRLLERGTTQIRWPMGGCGEGFMQGQSRLTQLIYGRTFPSGDLRQQAVQEWYFRELSRYLKDRGLIRVHATIGDEIPPEKLSWWVQHAYRCLQMGLNPGVTQSVHLLRDDKTINMVSPYMKHWIIGTIHKESLDLRRQQNIIKPEHWLTTYESSACHWKTYDQLRNTCGIKGAYYGLDAVWIQVYYRWSQGEAVIYPGDNGPVSSAAWEGARDGLNDGNYYLLALKLVSALPAGAERSRYEERLEAIVGARADSLVRFGDQLSGVGVITNILSKTDTTVFRSMRERLLALNAELAGKVPVQKANVLFGQEWLVRDGIALHRLPAGMAGVERVRTLLTGACGGLQFTPPAVEQVDGRDPYPLLFCGSLSELRSLLPELARHPDLSDLSDSYPAAGAYVIRCLRPAGRSDGPFSLVILGGDNSGLDKAMTNLAAVLTFPKMQYSHWLTGHISK